MKSNRCATRVGAAGRDGVALVVVLTVMMVVSIVGAGLMHMAMTNATQAARSLVSSQCFWLAEAGLSEAKARLVLNSSFRKAPTVFQTTTAYGRYRVTVLKTNVFDYVVTSEGTIQQSTRVVRELVKLTSPWHHSFTRFAIFGGGTPDVDDADDIMKIEGKSRVVGNVFHNGNIEVKKKETLITGGYVYVPPGFTVKGDGQYEQGVYAKLDPSPRMPDLDTSYYVNEIAIAKTGGTNLVEKDRVDLGGGTVYLGGSLKLKKGGIITGPGRVVVAKDVALDKGVLVEDDVMIIAGKKASFKNECVFGRNTIIYGHESVEMADEDSMDQGGVLISPKEVKLKKRSSLVGVAIFAGSKTVKMEDRISISGAVVSGAKVELLKDSSVTHDPTALPDTLPPGLESNVVGWTVSGAGWQEN